ncbi:MAG: tyrosine-type recombinase/integrase [Bacteroidetes bacterium]|nr:tyrosine-type recombinase/integrase [Bacteroidota bacterium]
MPLKGQKTTSSYVDWNAITNLILKLERDGNWKFALLISVGIFTGLRISDILSLHWSDILNKESMGITEKKTKKFRNIRLNPQLFEIVSRVFKSQKVTDPETLIFLNRWGTQAFRTQYVNTTLKKLFIKYKVTKDGTSISAHSLRKTFGRRIWEVNQNSEKALVILSEVLKHSSVATTKIYLGIREEEISEIYLNL